MVDLKYKIEAECENIERLINELPSPDRLAVLEFLELAGVAALLHNFYNGIENIIKLIFKDRGIDIPEGASWHKELLNLAKKNGIISGSVLNEIGEYLAFRHFFSHAYALDLYVDKLEPLVEKINKVYQNFKQEVNCY